MFIGGALIIIFVGILIFYVGWIFAAIGFFFMKARTPPNYPPPSQQIPVPSTAQKSCSYCGAENNVEAVFCVHCGNKLKQALKKL